MSLSQIWVLHSQGKRFLLGTYVCIRDGDGGRRLKGRGWGVRAVCLWLELTSWEAGGKLKVKCFSAHICQVRRCELPG